MAKLYEKGQHPLSSEMVSANAKEVIQTLQNSGFCAYIVGGAVRDILLEQTPKDYDVATDAKPEEVRHAFKNSRIIGRRFRIVHVYFKRDIIEVSTFRGSHNQAEATGDAETRNGIITRDNVFGTLDEDAERRDLTINAMYYDPINEELWDHSTSVLDLKAKRVRIIGNPEARFQEDPIRILRAIRFANKLDFKIESKTKAAIPKLVDTLEHIPAGRRFDEYTKLFLHGSAAKNFHSLIEFKALSHLFPGTEQHLTDEQFKALILDALNNTDNRLKQDKKVNPAFLIAVILWKTLEATQKALMQKEGITETMAFFKAIDETISRQIQYTAMPRRLNRTIKEIWSMQLSLERRRPRQIMRLLHHARFRAAYDFLIMRCDYNGLSKDMCTWWTDIQNVSPDDQHQMIQALGNPPKAFKKKRRRKPKPKPTT